ncbi:hypothetical protein ILYODFUR_008525 [Ilyodon furcidens]|uniref:Metalloproteinase inhibitor 4 n=1 Tax=Ilyodon furcidens TaxID=33524 RepID=A0ABV0TID2_9TELE
MAVSQERRACLGLVVLLLLAGMDEVVEGCSCHPAHPQQLFCSAEIVIRAKISGEKIVSPSNSSSPYMKMIQYEIKMIKMFKGFDRAKDIQYVYTPVFSSLCGVKLDSNNKAGYLLSGSMWSDGRISIGQCDLVELWDNLSLSQKKNLNYRYQMGCECRGQSATCWLRSRRLQTPDDKPGKKSIKLKQPRGPCYLCMGLQRSTAQVESVHRFIISLDSTILAYMEE